MSALKLFVIRHEGTSGFTSGQLYVDGQWTCFTLEDEVREVPGQPVASWKIPGKTAIPRGKYRVVVNYSPRFGKRLPEILNAPGFVGIRIHPGNKAEDTKGCILLGDEDSSDGFMGRSRDAFDRVFAKINETINSGEEVWITLE